MGEIDIFKPVMDNDEEILRIYRPDRVRAYFGTIMVCLLMCICFIPIIIAAFVAPELERDIGMAIGCIVFLVVFIVLSILMIALWCNKTIYAVTNKRILIRTGYIGVDYKSLNYDTVGALTVNVNWVDKLIHRNTGTLSFGSMASPMINNANYRFSFLYIKAPYEVYKDLKNLIDSKKDTETK